MDLDSDIHNLLLLPPVSQAYICGEECTLPQLYQHIRTQERHLLVWLETFWWAAAMIGR